VFEKYRSVHFIGIGGIGMSGIAEVLFNLGYEVTGSDSKESETVHRLKNLGIPVEIGQKQEHVANAHVVVVSSAVSNDNPEVVAARNRSIPVIPRAEMLAELARLKYGILVAGTHGKTTTTSLIAAILGYGDFDPTIVIGGKLKALGSNAKLGQGDFIVAEADESDGSFLMLSPTIAIVTNIDREHMEFFETIEKLKEAFLSFMNKVPFYGVSIICAEDANVRDLIPHIHRRFMTYGFSDSFDIYVKNIRTEFMRTSFDVVYRNEELGQFMIPLPGTHNVLNALACIGVSMELQIAVTKIKEALRLFGGIQRRFEFKGEVNGITVYDDYGHHPAEITATLGAARENLKYIGADSRLIVIFQPHRYSRTADLMEEFALSFAEADLLCLMEIYPAGEKPIQGVTSKVLGENIRARGYGTVSCAGSSEEVMSHVLAKVKPGDLILTLGAGNVWKTGELLLERLKQADK
jgi:UDP-N-acetylmuramate--alanine ligase